MTSCELKTKVHIFGMKTIYDTVQQCLIDCTILFYLYWNFAHSWICIVWILRTSIFSLKTCSTFHDFFGLHKCTLMTHTGFIRVHYRTIKVVSHFPKVYFFYKIYTCIYRLEKEGYHCGFMYKITDWNR